jgi:hypothetical protein
MRALANRTGRAHLWASSLIAGSLFARGALAGTPPDQMGPYSVAQWNPASQDGGTPPPIPSLVIYPTNAPQPGVIVALVHGAGESGAFKVKVGTLMASRGLVAVLPSYANLLLNPTQTDADQLNMLLDWAVTQGKTASTPLYGKVDDSQFGIAGHSNGGISFCAASTNQKVKAVLGWDAVAGLSCASGFHGPSLSLESQGKQCGGGSPAGFMAAPAPKAIATIVSGSHCDFDDPFDSLCSTVCGAPAANATAQATIERLSVAWFVCLLGHDPSMQLYTVIQNQQGVTGVTQMGTITCQGEGDAGLAAEGSSGAKGGGGGCACRASSGGGRVGGLAALCGVVATLIARRRRT